MNLSRAREGGTALESGTARSDGGEGLDVSEMRPWTILLAFLVGSGLGQQERPPSARMDQIALSFANARQFMGSVLVARGNELLFDKSYGMANLEWGVPNAPTTKFRIGSLTKQFTAAAVLLLEERGKLRIEDPIRKYVPDAPVVWGKVTSFPDYAAKSLSPMSAQQRSPGSRR